MLTGNVFRTLFDVDAVGDDYELFDTYRCGKNGQVIRVSAGGPSIRVKKLSIS
jgi:TldD protein